MTTTEDDRGPRIRAVAVTLFAIATVAIIMRCYVRIRIAKACGWDDWLMVAAMVSYTCNTATCLAGVAYGTGQHYWLLEPEDLSLAMMYWWYCYLTYATSMVFSKASIAVFILRITPQRVHRSIVYAALILSIVSGLVFFFIALLQCRPVWAFWSPTAHTPEHCLSTDVIINVVYGYSCVSIVTDLTFTILPVWLVWHLNMDMRTKIALIPIVSMAFVASCAVAVRLAYVNDFRTNDFLWSTSDIAIWSQTEQGLAIAAGSLATLKPLLRRAMHILGFGSRNLSENEPAPSDGIRTFGQGSGKSFLSHKAHQRSWYNISNFTRMDDAVEVVEVGPIGAAGGRDVELGVGEQVDGTRAITDATDGGPREDGRDSLRLDHVDYRVSIRGKGHEEGWSAPSLDGISEEELQGITKKTSYHVV